MIWRNSVLPAAGTAAIAAGACSAPAAAVWLRHRLQLRSARRLTTDDSPFSLWIIIRLAAERNLRVIHLNLVSTAITLSNLVIPRKSRLCLMITILAAS